MLRLPAILLSRQALLRRARADYEAGRLQAASRAVEEIHRRLRGVKSSDDPLLGEAHFLTGSILAAQGRRIDAAESFLQAHTYHKSDPESIAFVVSELLPRGDRRPTFVQLCLDYFDQKPASQDPLRVEYLRSLEDLLRPKGDEPRWEETQRLNEAVVQRLPALAWPHRHLGEVALRREDWGAAVQSLERAIDLEPDNAYTDVALCYALFRLGETKRAEARVGCLLKRKRVSGALLLRSCLRRRRGDAAGAALDFLAGSRGLRLSTSEALVLAELLTNAQRVQEADRLLARLRDRTDSRWLAAASAVDQLLGRPGDALHKLRQIPPQSPLGPPAVRRLLSIVAAHPDVPVGLAALEAVPPDLRDDPYWLIRGNADLAHGCPAEALSSWLRIERPSRQARQAIRRLARQRLIALGQSRNRRGLMNALEAGLAAVAGAEAVRTAIGGTIEVEMKACRGQPRRELAAELLELLDRAEETLGGPLGKRWDVLRGVLTARSERFRPAMALLRPLLDDQHSRAKVALEYARCAAMEKDAQACALALDYLDLSDPGHRQVAAVCACLCGRWGRALDLLGDARAAGPVDGLVACAMFHAGRLDRLNGLDGGSSEVRYYQAAGEAARGRLGAAEHLLETVAPEDNLQTRAKALLSWTLIQRGRGLLAEGDLAGAQELYVRARSVAPAEDRPVVNDDDLRSRVLLRRRRRRELRDSLEACAASAGPGDPVSCHNLAVFHLAEGARYAQAGRAREALDQWQRCIAYMGATLACFSYVERWSAERARVYAASLDSEMWTTLPERVVQHLVWVFDHWLERWRSAVPPVPPRFLGDLPLTLRAELEGARKLRELGGFAARGDSQPKISAGACYLVLQGLDGPFHDFISSMPVKGSFSMDGSGLSPQAVLLHLLESLMEGSREGAVDVETKRELERLFSPLRAAWVLQQDGNLAAALERVESLRHRRAPRQTDENLLLANPAFLDQDRQQAFLTAIGEFEIALLLQLGEKAVSSQRGVRSDGVKHWRRAMERAGEIGEVDPTEAAVAKTALGRTDALVAHDRTDEAIRLLEEVGQICSGEEILGRLAALYAGRGIQAVNEGNVETGVADLRRAYQSNPHSSHIGSQFSVALRMRAREVFPSDQTEAVTMLEEAARLARVCAENDPSNEEFRELAIGAEREWRQATMAARIASPAQLLEMLTSSLDSRRMSTMYHNRGIEKAERDDFQGAVEDLERALELEPNSDATKSALGQVLFAYSFQLVGQGRMTESFRHLARARELTGGG